ncbi:hypothetical protein A3844_25055 [Paenibacillus helianthi]|uniref:DUF3102 domain-containing protein n=1 Tax=Paenibacillus helianthi TaxID=1349432 RepID=A0ABX3EJQ8_9BACL|nr:DUF3102 domain-containing protein [Paenibacillus helianthi]OKP81857.1 hypothetical protein A3844_25055 [Paenibacillus helianthi]
MLTAEIHAYKRVAGEAIFEIGRRLKHVKENDLVHGQFGAWARDSFGFHATTSSRLIAAYEQFGEFSDVAKFESGKIFEMLTLPAEIDRAEFVSSPHTVPSTGAAKRPDEMTVRELREVKAAIPRQISALRPYPYAYPRTALARLIHGCT